MTINDSDGNGFWAVKVETHMHTNYTMLDFNISDLDMGSDINDKAPCAELTSAEDEQALDLFGSDNQLVSEGED
jgi:hypothetical protein